MTGGAEALGNPALRLAAGSIAWSFRALFNVPDVMLLLRGLYQGPEEGPSRQGRLQGFMNRVRGRSARSARTPYWQLVLAYMAAGGIQAVLDEYAHVVREPLGLVR